LLVNPNSEVTLKYAHDEIPNDMLNNVKKAFENFIKKSIYYFQVQDSITENNLENLEKDLSMLVEDVEVEDVEVEEAQEYLDMEKKNKMSPLSILEKNTSILEKNMSILEKKVFEDELEEDVKDVEEEDVEVEEDNLDMDKKEPIIVKKKYKVTNSQGVENIQQLPLNWFQRIRLNK
jgi:hypothetical protein